MEKIKMSAPLCEMDGDEMTRVLWQAIKEKLILPFVDLKTEYFDLGLVNRNLTDDRVTLDAAESAKRLKVAVKCATITPNTDRVKEYNLKKMWKSPNGTIRAALDGTVFRTPVLTRAVSPLIPGWKKPITIARHAYGDIYDNVEFAAQKGDRAELCITHGDGTKTCLPVFEFDGNGVVQGVHNTSKSVEAFAKTCFEYALSVKQDLWFAAKDTISKTYDGRFKQIFCDMFENEYRQKFENSGINFYYMLIDDAVARAVRSEGGFVWACKNYDGDVLSDMAATAFGSLAMMKSVLVSPDGAYEFEAAHGTVTRHYRKYMAGEETSTNSVATIFAWSGALDACGRRDGNKALCGFAAALEKAVLDTVESGVMTGDLYAVSTLENRRKVSSFEFIDEIGKRLAAAL